MKDDQQLIDGYLEGELSSGDERRLAEWLDADPEHVREFVRETHLNRQLREAMVARVFEEAGFAAAMQAERRSTSLTANRLQTALTQIWQLPWLRLPWTWAAAATCLALAIGFWLWCFGGVVGKPILAEIEGTGFSLERGGKPMTVASGAPLQPGDVLRTGSEATADLSFRPESTHLRIGRWTELELTSLSSGKRFALRLGSMKASVAGQRPFKPMVILTPQAKARVLGTEFSLTVTNDSTRLDVTQGRVRLTRARDSKALRVDAGDYAVAAVGERLVALPITGCVLREVWRNVQGSGVHDLILHPGFPDRPEQHDFPAALETLKETNTIFGLRLRGYLIPEEADDYTFTLSASGAAALWLSEDDSPENRVTIAQASAATQPGTTMRTSFNSTQSRSAPVRLERGRRYYIEVLQLRAVGQGQPGLKVLWTRPGHEAEEIPPGCLAPFVSQKGAIR